MALQVETFIKVETFRVEYECDECGNGKMEFNGVSNPTWPPLYHHDCTNCGANQVFRGEKYPKIVTKDLVE